MIYGWLTDWLTDPTVQGLTNWLNDLWLVAWLSNWPYCPGTDQLTEWLMAGWLTEPTGKRIYSLKYYVLFRELNNTLNDLQNVPLAD